MGTVTEALPLAPPTAGTVPMAGVLAVHASAEPGRTAVVVGGASISYGDLDRRSSTAAALFLDRGVTAGSTVAVGLPNSIEFFVAVFAAWKAGAVPLPLSHRLPGPELETLLELAAPALVVGLPAAGVPCLSRGELADPGGAARSALPDFPGDQPWKIIGSGGSTGRPKLIVAGRPARTQPDEEQYTIRPGDVVLAPGPLYHQGPFIFTTAGLFQGNTVVTTERFDAEATLRAIGEQRVTWAYLVPTMTHRIWRLPAAVRDAADLSSLRLLVSTGSSWAPWLKESWIRWLGPERVLEMYGGTEEQGGLSISGHESLRHPGSVGRAHEGVRVIRPDGSPADTGEVGELVFRRRPAAGHRYIGAPDPEGQWRGYGDLASIDRDGYVHIADRRTDLIVSGGVNVYPAEVESALEAHPGVAGAVVVGLPDDDLGQRVHAVVQPSDQAAPPTADDLRAHLRGLIVRAKVPRSFEFVTGPLRDDAGKVRRAAIRDERLGPGGGGGFGADAGGGASGPVSGEPAGAP